MTDKPTLMVFSAHTADFISRCGGTIAKYSRAGSTVFVVCLSYGERGESPRLWRERAGITVDEVKRVRQEEMARAAHVLGAEVTCLDCGDNPLVVGKDDILKMMSLLYQYRPQIVLTHWTQEPMNPDHATAADVALRTVSHAALVDMEGAPLQWPQVYLFEPSVPETEETHFRPDTYIDITDVFETKMEALRQLETQPYLAEFYQRYGEYRAWQARDLTGRKDIKYAEAFARYSPWTGSQFPL
mgnify:CR=1 FL=1